VAAHRPIAPDVSDSELIARVMVSDDHAAFGELVNRHQSSVRNFLRHLTSGDHALADDLAQETFVQAYRGLTRFRGASVFLTWLLGIAHNQWRNHRRRPAALAVETSDLDRLDPVPASAHLSDLKHDLSAALRHLDAEERTVLHLHYQEGLSQSEIAAVLDWPLGTVKTTLTRSREKLRPHLASWNPKT
jgi:RNA polymerase sigma factor (sigma-70 family)